MLTESTGYKEKDMKKVDLSRKDTEKYGCRDYTNVYETQNPNCPCCGPYGLTKPYSGISLPQSYSTVRAASSFYQQKYSSAGMKFNIKPLIPTSEIDKVNRELGIKKMDDLFVLLFLNLKFA